MPYKKGALKGKLTTAEIRKLVRAHNKLSKITIPPNSDRDKIINIIAKSGFRVNHEQQRLEQTSKKDITLDKAKEAVKPKPKTDLQKQKTEEAKKAREDKKKKEERVVRKKAVVEEKKRTKPKAKAKGVSIGVGTDKPKFKIDQSKQSKTTPSKIDIKIKPASNTKKIIKEIKGNNVKINFRNEKKILNTRETDIQSDIEKQYPGYEGYDRVILITLQRDAIKEGKTPTFEVLVKKNEGKDLQVQFGVEGSSRYGKRIILKKKKSGNDKDKELPSNRTPDGDKKEKEIIELWKKVLNPELREFFKNGEKEKQKKAYTKSVGILAKYQSKQSGKSDATERKRIKSMGGAGNLIIKYGESKPVKKIMYDGVDISELFKLSGNDKDKGDAEKKPEQKITVKKIVEDLISNSDEKILPFTSMPDSSLLFYSVILEKNKNDCSIPNKILKDIMNITMPPNQYLKREANEISMSILECDKKSNGKKAVVVPVSLRVKGKNDSHANALVFNTQLMTAEHFEPHGRFDYRPNKNRYLTLTGVNLNPAITEINKKMKLNIETNTIELTDEQKKKLKKGFKYVRPVDVCPSQSMYKNFDGLQQFDVSKKEPVDFEGFQIKEKGGYCQAWTYFLLDLRLKTLDTPSQEVLKEYATYRDIYKTSIGGNPNKTITGLIRGYSKQYFDIIKQLINEGKFTLEEFLEYRKNKGGAVMAKISFLIRNDASKRIQKVMAG